MTTRIKEKNSGGVFDSEKEKAIKEILSNLIEENNPLLTEKETEVLRLILIEDKKVAEAGTALKLTPKRIRDIYYFAIRRLNNKLSNLHVWLNNEARMQ